MNAHERIITELATCERRMDTVLFARNDDDEDDRGPGLGTAAVGASTLGGAGIGGAYLRGRAANAASPMLPGFSGPGVTSTIGTGFKALGQDVKGLGKGSKDLYKSLLERAKKGISAFRA